VNDQQPFNPAPGSVDAPSLAWVIAPMSPAEFLERHYERRHVVIQRGQAEYFSDVLSLADTDAVLTRQVLADTDVQLVKTGGLAASESFTTVHGDIDPVRALQLFRRGYTLVFRSLNRRLPKLQALCRSLENDLNCDMQTNVYLTPPGSQGGRTHFDTHDVLVLQCQGTKRWRIYAGPVALPLPSQAFRSTDFDPGPVIDEFELGPGDVAYLPRGTVHDAVCGDDLSLHVTAGLLTYRWIDLLQEVLLAETLRDPELRRSLPPGYALDATARKHMVERCRVLLQNIADGTTAPAVVERFATGFRASRQPEADGQLLQEASPASVDIGTLVAVRSRLLWSITASVSETHADNRIRLQAHGTEIIFPADIEPTLREAMTRPHFKIGELSGSLDPAGQLVLVRRLLSEGVLRILKEPPEPP